MNQSHMRSMLAETLDMLGKLLQTSNEAFALAHAILQVTHSQDPKRGILIDSHFERLRKTSKDSETRVLQIMGTYQRQLVDDSQWTDYP